MSSCHPSWVRGFGFVLMYSGLCWPDGPEPASIVRIKGEQDPHTTRQNTAPPDIFRLPRNSISLHHPNITHQWISSLRSPLLSLTRPSPSLQLPLPLTRSTMVMVPPAVIALSRRRFFYSVTTRDTHSMTQSN